MRFSFARRPRDGYFFRAEFQAHFASLLDQRRADPDFCGDPYSRYGGRSLHTRSHGEAFLAVMLNRMESGVVVMDEPVLLTFPQADIVSFDETPLRSVRLEDTSHYQITRGILEAPERYWRQLLMENADGQDSA